jgi:hypothetical protein
MKKKSKIIKSRYNFIRRLEIAKISVAWLGSFGFLILGLIINVFFSLLLPIIFSIYFYNLFNRPQKTNHVDYEPGVGTRYIYITNYQFNFEEQILIIAAAIFLFSLYIAFVGAPTIRLIWVIWKQNRAAKDVSSLEKLPPKFAALIKERINKLSLEMTSKQRNRLKNCSIIFLFERRNHKATPCMIYASGSLNLIFPLGFFKTLQSDPEVADAMLAHELGHYIHRDSNLLLNIRSYFKAANVIFNNIAIGVVFTFVVSIITLQLIEEEKNKIREVKQGKSINLGYSIQELDRQLERLDQEKLRTILQTPLSFFAFGYYYLLILFLRRRIRRSEEIADYFAAIITSPFAVSRFLNDYIDNKDDAESLHPPVNQRIEYINKYQHALA